jgi:hypothetical protein
LNNIIYRVALTGGLRLDDARRVGTSICNVRVIHIIYKQYIICECHRRYVFAASHKREEKFHFIGLVVRIHCNNKHDNVDLYVYALKFDCE